MRVEETAVLVSLVPMFVCWVVIRIRYRRNPELSQAPRQILRYARATFYCGLPPISIYGYQLLYSPRGMHSAMYVPVAVYELFIAGCGYVGFIRRQTDRQVTVNYAEEPGFRGQCGYDLTGNVSGICPECGWRDSGGTEGRTQSEVDSLVAAVAGRVPA